MRKFLSSMAVNRTVGSVCALALWAHAALLVQPAQADPLLDFGFFDVPTAAQLAMKAPVVRWLVHPDAETLCTHTQPQTGHANWQDGCAYWHLASNSCTIVTTASTTHSQMGHLFLHCLKAQ